MKRNRKTLIIALLLLMLMFVQGICAVQVKATGEVAINEANFPDNNFRQYIRNHYDDDKNDILSAAEIAAVSKMDVSSESISDLTGLEFFTELTDLEVSDNSLTELDISSNTKLLILWCSGNQLTELDISNNPALKELACSGNQLTSLDVSGNPELRELYCADNPLKTLDVSANTKLGRLECARNQLTALDVSNNTRLVKLFCCLNDLTSLNVKSCSELEHLACYGNRIATLDVSNCPRLIEAYEDNRAETYTGTDLDGADLPYLDYSDPMRDYSLDVDMDTQVFTVEPLLLPYTEKTILVGENFQFSVTGTLGQTVNWTTDDVSVAAVDRTGKLMGISAGSTYLYASTSDGRDAKCLIKVVTPLSIRYSTKTIYIGTPFQFTATGGAGDYTWRVGNSAVATVDSTGKVSGVSAGNTYLYCKDASGLEVKCLLKVTAPLSIRYGAKTILIGTPFQFTATGGSGTYTWRTGNTAVAAVDSTGKVTGKSVGNTYLYCKDSAGTEVKCYLEVREPLSIRYGAKTILIGTPFQFTATGGTGGYTWRTGNTSVATVDSTGKVTGKTEGNTYLYCKDSSGTEVRCYMEVRKPLSIRYSTKTIYTGTPFTFEATGGTGGYTWRTGNSSVATVDSNGKVTGKTVGNTYLYCKDSAGTEVKCLLKIAAGSLSIRYTDKTVSVGSSFQFTATGGTGGYTWHTGNTSVATVDSTGKVTGVAVGNTYLYCKDSAGNEVKCLLKIK